MIKQNLNIAFGELWRQKAFPGTPIMAQTVARACIVFFYIAKSNKRKSVIMFMQL
jgi:hypothetical protein